MKLKVIINNGLACLNFSHSTGAKMAISRRWVEIDLTNEQVGKLALKQIGQNGNIPYYETIESISLG